MKVTVSAILTTLVGGNPVLKKYSSRAVKKLLKQNSALNARLPFVINEGQSEEELVELNRRAKKLAIFEMCPELEEIEPEIEIACLRLNNEMKKCDGKLTGAYKLTAKYILDLAVNFLGDDVTKLYFPLPTIK